MGRMTGSDGRFADSVMLDRAGGREDPGLWYSTSPLGIVASAHYRATEAGVSVLADGGNAVDAAVATSLALGVAEPAGSGLGGMAMMMVHLAGQGRTFLIEGPCRAPADASPETFKSLAKEYMEKKGMEDTKKNRILAAGLVRKSGYKSIAVPTNPATLAYALKKYGTMGPERVLEPAIRLAEQGFLITPMQNMLLKEYASQIRKGNAKGLLFGGRDDVPEAGTLMKQPVLAETLKRLSRYGFEDFYTGSMGMEMLADMEENGGLISARDLSAIPWPRESAPVRGTFRDWEVMSTPPPGGGIALIEMLNIFESMGMDGSNPDMSEAALAFAYIINRARLDRRESFTLKHRKPADLLSKEYAGEAASEIMDEISGRGETTHLNVIDRHGNVVAMTQSIERSFGSKVATSGLGFLYNGFMKAFKLRSRDHPHYLRPGALARSNASPTILLRDGKPLYAIGSTGSERMVSGMFQVLVRLLSQTPFEAVKAPRLHCTPERQVFLEAARFRPGAIEELKKHGFETVAYDSWSFSVGGLQLAGIDDGICWGVAEPRRDGAAAGPLK